MPAAAAAAAKSLQSCPTLCDPLNSSPPGSAVPGILQARTLEWVAISFSNAWKWKVKVKSLSRVRLFTTPWTAAHQAPPSMGYSRQEYWSGVPLPSPYKQCLEPGKFVDYVFCDIFYDWIFSGKSLFNISKAWVPSKFIIIRHPLKARNNILKFGMTLSKTYIGVYSRTEFAMNTSIKFLRPSKKVFRYQRH